MGWSSSSRSCPRKCVCLLSDRVGIDTVEVAKSLYRLFSTGGGVAVSRGAIAKMIVAMTEQYQT